MTAEKLDPEKTEYTVVIDHEEIYSIWLTDREIPDYWKTVGFEGTKQECQDYIEEVWTDMRPLSLRTRLEEADKQ
ncbi:MAG: MbtH family NRPS accessory protein [Rhodothermales bacterium]|nr:MbtH family NRPS accessory protein [Rhodothermales bacterium]